MYSRRLGDQTLTFGHTGDLANESFLMYDVETESTWLHVTGEAGDGKMKGHVLTFLPAVTTTWSKWKEIHPETFIVTTDRGYHVTGDARIEGLGLSVGQSDRVKLYSFESLQRSPVINDVLNGTNIVVICDPQTRSAVAFERGSRTFGWKDGMMFDESDQQWDPLRGVSRTTPEVESLTPLPATQWLVERWQSFYPNEEIYEP